MRVILNINHNNPDKSFIHLLAELKSHESITKSAWIRKYHQQNKQANMYEKKS
jgi:hypothetical protein